MSSNEENFKTQCQKEFDKIHDTRFPHASKDWAFRLFYKSEQYMRRLERERLLLVLIQRFCKGTI